MTSQLNTGATAAPTWGVSPVGRTRLRGRGVVAGVGDLLIAQPVVTRCRTLRDGGRVVARDRHGATAAAHRRFDHLRRRVAGLSEGSGGAIAAGTGRPERIAQLGGVARRRHARGRTARAQREQACHGRRCHVSGCSDHRNSSGFDADRRGSADRPVGSCRWESGRSDTTIRGRVHTHRRAIRPLSPPGRARSVTFARGASRQSESGTPSSSWTPRLLSRKATRW